MRTLEDYWYEDLNAPEILARLRDLAAIAQTPGHDHPLKEQETLTTEDLEFLDTARAAIKDILAQFDAHFATNVEFKCKDPQTVAANHRLEALVKILIASKKITVSNKARIPRFSKYLKTHFNTEQKRGLEENDIIKMWENSAEQLHAAKQKITDLESAISELQSEFNSVREIIPDSDKTHQELEALDREVYTLRNEINQGETDNLNKIPGLKEKFIALSKEIEALIDSTN